MAARLTVIMVHSPPANAAAHKIAESVVGEVIGRPGIDLTLVGPLKQIAAESTDHLTLESVTGDVAALDWKTPQDLVETLNEIGFPGTRSPHPDDADAAPTTPGQRRIYAFDLNQTTDAKELCAALNELLSQRNVRTFTLGSLAPQSISPVPTPAVKAIPNVATQPAPNIAPAAKQDTQATSSENGIDLDDLVDQLDMLDP